jgi:hypothetical protein
MYISLAFPDHCCLFTIHPTMYVTFFQFMSYDRTLTAYPQFCHTVPQHFTAPKYVSSVTELMRKVNCPRLVVAFPQYWPGQAFHHQTSCHCILPLLSHVYVHISSRNMD